MVTTLVFVAASICANIVISHRSGSLKGTGLGSLATTNLMSRKHGGSIYALDKLQLYNFNYIHSYKYLII